MSRLVINGTTVERTIEPRTHLADFLREDLLLTATHLGCEQGVCGACTVLIDGAPARACLTPAALCTGQHIQTLEGIETDPVITALREAFTAEHALQCGYCTPGMLITARDIVLRLPDADEACIRLELAGNLCRCTGYAGIVKAIRRVLDLHLPVDRPDPAPIASGSFVQPVPATGAGTSTSTLSMGSTPATSARPGKRLIQTMRLDLPAERVWTALQDPRFVATCVPGAELTAVVNERIEGNIRASLGPIRVRFEGTATLGFEAASRSGTIEGSGRDRATGTALSGDARFQVEPEGENASTITLSIGYSLRGPLSQFSRGPIVEVFAAELTERTARSLEARLRGEGTVNAPVEAASPIGVRLLASVLWRMLRRLLGLRQQ